MNESLMLSWQRRIFILCWLAYALAYFCRVNFSVALPEIQQSFGWSNASIGLIGSSLFWVYAVGQLINGHLGDNLRAREFVFVGLAVSAIINLLFGFMSSLFFMALLWGINGYFQSMLWGPIVKTLSHWFPNNKRNRVAVGISTSMIAGYLLAWGLSGIILTHTSWPWAFWFPGFIVIIFASIWYGGIRNHPSEIGLALKGEQREIINREYHINNKSLALFQVFKDFKLILPAIACLAQGLIKDSITLWGPKFLLETQRLTIKSTVTFVLLIPIMNFFGILFAGWLNKKLYHQEKPAIILLFTAGLFSCFGLFLFANVNILVSTILLACSSAFMFGANTLLLTVIPLNYARYNKVSTVAGTLDFCCYLGAGTAGVLTGFLVDYRGWSSVLMFWVIMSIVGILSMLVSWRNERLLSIPKS